MPLPVRLTVAETGPEAVPLIVRVPWRVLVTMGEKRRFKVQVYPAARVVPAQSPVTLKSPVMFTLEMVSGPLPLLVTVTTRTALVLPMAVSGNAMLVGVTVSAPVTPLPKRLVV